MPAAKPSTVAQYLAALPVERKAIITAMHRTVLKRLPKGFAACINYGMISYVVPHSIYPSGYHCDPKMPLWFMGLASQKSHIGLYHMGVYLDPATLKWFTSAWPKHSKKRLDMGKSCIRFKKSDDVPLALVGELAGKMTVTQWISIYESKLKR
ncbi:MAG: DUF1801 domain-containing protein [Phycisphaerales bacterium]|nr:DUF1801 domain-containing protein [Phycisphaerales bacterium]